MAAQMAGSCDCSMDIGVVFVQKSIVRDIDRIWLSETIALRPVSRWALAPVFFRPVGRSALAPVFFRPLGRSAQTLVFTTQQTGIVSANCETVNLGQLTANGLGTTTR